VDKLDTIQTFVNNKLNECLTEFIKTSKADIDKLQKDPAILIDELSRVSDHAEGFRSAMYVVKDAFDGLRKELTNVKEASCG